MSRRIALLGCVLLAACGGGSDGTATQVLTTLTVTLTPNAVQVGQTATAAASGADQTGASMPTGTVTWSSDAPTATVSASGTVTAVAPGSAIITGTAGGKSAQAVFTIVPRPAVAMVFVTPMPASVANRIVINPAPVVQLVNSLGAAVAQAGIVVSTAASAGGVAGVTTATTDANGRATFSGFGLAGKIGPRTIVFSAPGMTNLSSGVVTLTVGPPVIGIIVAGDQQSAVAGSNVAIAPSLRVVDPDSNVTPNIPMEFAVAIGGGSVTGSPAITDANGIATLGSWKLGATPGTNGLLVRPVGFSGGIPFTATGTAPVMGTATAPVRASRTAPVTPARMVHFQTTGYLK